MDLFGKQVDQGREWYAAREGTNWYLLEARTLEERARIAYREHNRAQTLPDTLQAESETSEEVLSWYVQSLHPRSHGVASARRLEDGILSLQYRCLTDIIDMGGLVYAQLSELEKYVSFYFADQTMACFPIMPDEKGRQSYYALLSEVISPDVDAKVK